MLVGSGSLYRGLRPFHIYDFCREGITARLLLPGWHPLLQSPKVQPGSPSLFTNPSIVSNGYFLLPSATNRNGVLSWGYDLLCFRPSVLGGTPRVNGLVLSEPSCLQHSCFSTSVLLLPERRLCLACLL